jgi:hypothetical protein
MMMMMMMMMMPPPFDTLTVPFLPTTPDNPSQQPPPTLSLRKPGDQSPDHPFGRSPGKERLGVIKELARKGARVAEGVLEIIINIIGETQRGRPRIDHGGERLAGRAPEHLARNELCPRREADALDGHLYG